MKIFEGYGLSLHQRDSKYYIRYLAGEIISWIVEIEITPDEARQVQLSMDCANAVVYKHQNECFAETGYYWRKSDFISIEEMREEGYVVSEGTQPPTSLYQRNNV